MSFIRYIISKEQPDSIVQKQSQISLSNKMSKSIPSVKPKHT